MLLVQVRTKAALFGEGGNEPACRGGPGRSHPHEGGPQSGNTDGISPGPLQCRRVRHVASSAEFCTGVGPRPLFDSLIRFGARAPGRLSLRPCGRAVVGMHWAAGIRGRVYGRRAAAGPGCTLAQCSPAQPQLPGFRSGPGSSRRRGPARRPIRRWCRALGPGSTTWPSKCGRCGRPACRRCTWRPGPKRRPSSQPAAESPAAGP